MNKISLIVFMCLIAFTVAGQQTDISGNWKLKDKKSISGKLYSNAFPQQFGITLEKDRITFSATEEKLFPADIVGEEKNTVDGKIVESTIGSKKRKKTVSVSYNVKEKKYTRTSTIYQEDGKNAYVTYSDILYTDNGELILQRRAENFTNGEVWEARGYYGKE